MKKKEINLNAGIYVIKTNSDKILYIGATQNLEKRFNDHYYMLENNKHTNLSLQNICNKISFGNLNFSVLMYCNNDLFIYEELFIRVLSPICNTAKNIKSIGAFSDLLIDSEYIESLNLQIDKKYLNKDFLEIKQFYKKLNNYCNENNYKLVKGNTSGNRFFIIKTK